MITPRRSHAATLLADGRVLVVGGLDATGMHARLAEIFDPTTGRWSPAGQLREGRYGHTASLLPDGTVLVVGGWVASDELRPTPTTERFDPVEMVWSAGPTLGVVRAAHTATVLDDGSLLVAGGSRYNGGVGDPGAGVEVLRPGARAWASSASLKEARAGHTATLLPDGDVLVVGGVGVESDEAAPFNTSLPTAERYDPGRDRWTSTGRLADGRMGHTAVLLDDGLVLLSRMGREGTAALFDPAEDRFVPTDDLIEGRFWHTSTGLPGGGVLVVGGTAYEDPGAGRTAERFDPVRRSWSLTAPMAGARTEHTATRLLDGRVLVAGGENVDGAEVGPAEIYEPD